jgi:hypothetical protein
VTLESLRREEFARQSWSRQRPFYCRLAPEYLWAEVRRVILEELKEEIQADRERTWAYATYFTYPSDEQIASIHEGGVFWSEIREVVGYRAAEALSLLAGLVRLEADGDDKELLTESFTNLWQQFTHYNYGHGYDTPLTRARLARMLASNNVFRLAGQNAWAERMLAYFCTEIEPWQAKPLAELFPDVLSVLGEACGDVVIAGESIDLGHGEWNLLSLTRALRWEQGRPEDFRPAPPPSVFYQLPYHRVKFTAARRLQTAQGLEDPFAATAAHFFNVLELRSAIVNELGGREFTLAEAARVCGDEVYAAQMALGQLIKVGLAESDGAIPWFHKDQRYRCRPEAALLR